MTECEQYGMMSGCDENCPVLIRGDCSWVLEETINVFNKIKHEFKISNRKHSK